MNFRMFLLGSFLFDGCTLGWTFWCSSTLWNLWRLFIYFLQKLLEAYKWEIICFDKQDDSFFEVQKNISLHLVHHCMKLMTLNILVYPWSNPLLFLDIFRVNVHDYYELHSYEHSELLIFKSFGSVILWGGSENLPSLYAYFLLSCLPMDDLQII